MKRENRDLQVQNKDLRSEIEDFTSKQNPEAEKWRLVGVEVGLAAQTYEESWSIGNRKGWSLPFAAEFPLRGLTEIFDIFLYFRSPFY